MPRKLAVIGSGLMGSGIAQVAAQAGWDVVLRDLTEDALGRGRRGIEASLAKFVEKERVTAADADAALARIVTTTDLDAAADADLVVEAVFEDADTKRELLRTLDGLVKDETVLASNTSAIPITMLAAATRRPDRVVGTHFFSPVPLMALCELVRGHLTSDQTLATAREFAESAGKTCIVVERDVAGFVTTRLIAALVVEAVSLYESGVASADDIDIACKLGFGHAMGPLATADLTGVDVLLHATDNIHRESKDGKFAAPELMRRMVDAGSLGRKSGQGFYSH
ncbi:3-hydroxyacyl-CoA dehydrogenase family protein [Streptomyces profundus]|uniref:3-hydroxyacyl-CoA dehydrogenase family protein n=1 Tax=Streptomyces profundus TaxID=2867410 RepID=UPI001D168B3B|nr:3-hydroxyacyl-CoA dehydrogenase family protein [Streptomyces sp. MA3_2.13]UED84011.1 3-hydroxyacyl-CoA dehydrogenase family protein [Streptomyces sp. MA3_2.13]